MRVLITGGTGLIGKATAERLLAKGWQVRIIDKHIPPEAILDGALCSCTACQRDGQHEPDCPVHDEPRGPCSCGRTEQSKGAG